MGERRTELSKVKQEDFLLRYSGIEIRDKEVREKHVHLSSFPEHLSVTFISLATMALFGIVTYKGGPGYISLCAFVVSILSLTMLWRKNAKKIGQRRKGTLKSGHTSRSQRQTGKATNLK